MLGNGIKQSTTGFATDLTLTTITGFPTLSAKYSVGTNGDPIPYAIIRNSDNVGVEWGWGHLSATNTLVRDRIVCTWNGTVYNDLNPTVTDLSTGGPYTVAVTDNSSLRPVSPAGTDTTINATNRFLMPGQWCGNASGSISLTANSMMIVPFRLDLAVTATAIGLTVNVAATTGTTKNTRCGIYRLDKNGHIGNLIAETTSTSVASTGFKQFLFPASLRLDPGWYFISMLTDGNATYMGTNTSAGPGICPAWGVSGGNATGRFINVTKAVAYLDTGPLFANPLGTTGLTYGADFSVSAVCPILVVTS